MFIFLLIIIILVVLVYGFMRLPMFGKLPTGQRLERIKRSPNYKNGSFQNLSPTPPLAEGTTYYSVIKEFFFDKKVRNSPTDAIPSVKTDLINLDISKDFLVWFGHSSYYMQLAGKRILVDPVFSGSVSPLPFGNKAFKGADIYLAEDMPEIDYLFITHDHWDHLDYKTILKLKPKVKWVFCPLGVGAHLEYWGFDRSRITEMDWNEQTSPESGFMVNTVSGRHFSGRGFKRNQSLWTAYVLLTPTLKVFIGGDSGYDTHFARIGNDFGPFDLAILENGQYNLKWRHIHMLPTEILQAAKDLKALRILPVHSSKFVLATHPWDEPLEQIILNNQKEHLNVITPRVGELVDLKDTSKQFEQWWKEVN